MNKKGQVLIAFILLLPIIFMLAGFIIDCGYLYIEKRKVDNNIKDTLEYGLKNIEEDTNVLEQKLRNQLNLNIEDIKKMNIKINDKIIEIELEKSKKGIFTLILVKSEYKISSHYKGYINNDEIIIRKEVS